MVDGWTGQWYPEEDYSKYPKEKWCDYDWICVAIRADGYEPKTSMEHLIDMVFAYWETESEEYLDEAEDNRIESILNWVRDSGGWADFDFEC